MATTLGNASLINVWASGGTVEEPDTEKTADGWQLNEQPAYEYRNFLDQQFGEKINLSLYWGTPAWYSGRTYAVGSTVTYNGSLWIAIAESANSIPASGSSDWSELYAGDLPTLVTATWEAFTDETEALISPVKLGAAIDTKTDTFVSDRTLADSDWEAGTSETLALVEPAQIAAAIAALSPVAATYTTTAVSLSTADTNITTTEAHGQGSTPDMVGLKLVCTTTDGGYAVGDALFWTASTQGDDSNGMSAFANATNLGVSIQNIPHFAEKDTSNIFNPDGDSWTVQVYAMWWR